MARKPGVLIEPNNEPLDPGAKQVTISVVPEALIVSQVVLPTSEALDTIEVEIYRRQVQDGRAHWLSNEVAATKSNGEFRFSGLSAGAYKLFTHELMDRAIPRHFLYGYAPAYFPNVTDLASANTIQLSAGKTFQADLSLIRRPYYLVKVAVTNVARGGDMKI